MPPEIPVIEQPYFTLEEMLQTPNGQWKVLFATVGSYGIAMPGSVRAPSRRSGPKGGKNPCSPSSGTERKSRSKQRKGIGQSTSSLLWFRCWLPTWEPAKAGRVLATRNDTPFRKSNVRRKLNQILKKLDLAPAEQAPCFSTCRVSVLQAKGARRLDCGMGRALKPADDIWVHAISRMNFADELCAVLPCFSQPVCQRICGLVPMDPNSRQLRRREVQRKLLTIRD